MSTITGKNRIMICGRRLTAQPYQFNTAAGETLAISGPAYETRVLKHSQERMPYGLFVPDVARGTAYPDVTTGRHVSTESGRGQKPCGTGK
jgi:hypothetical protein